MKPKGVQPVVPLLVRLDRDRLMTPEEAVDYGLVDAIMAPRGAPVEQAA